MSLSGVIRTITKTITDKEKAKEIPLAIIQGTLSAAGQALQAVDRVKNSIKELGAGKNDGAKETTPCAGEEPRESERPRREPVIFAPRPRSPEPDGGPEASAQPSPTAAGADAVSVPAQASSAGRATAVKLAAEPAVETRTAETRTAEAEPAAPTETRAASTAGKENGLAEPLPGYGTLTVASLRARLRGKTSEQIQEFLAYEQATSARPEVLKMYTNRLAKLAAPE